MTHKDSRKTLYFYINKIYTVLGLSIADGGVMYNVTHVDFLQMNNSDIKSSQYALEDQSKHKHPNNIVDNVKMLDGKKVTIEDFIEMMDSYEDLNKHMRVIKQLKTLDKMVSWIYDNANIIAAVNIILVLFILGVVIKVQRNNKEIPVEAQEVLIKDEASSNNIDFSLESHTPLTHIQPIINSMRHGPIKKLEEIPKLRLDRFEKSYDESFSNLPRKISNTSIYVPNNETGSIEMLRSGDRKNKKRFYSPNTESVKSIKFSQNPTFAPRLLLRQRFPEANSSPIPEEQSSSISPNASFKQYRSRFAKHQEKHIQESYYAHNGEMIREVNQRKIIRYNDTPQFRKILSEGLFQQDARFKTPEPNEKHLSFNQPKTGIELLPTSDKYQNDFTDESFFKLPMTKIAPKNTATDFKRFKRSRTFKEDDPEYFFGTYEKSKNNKKRESVNIKSNMSHDPPQEQLSAFKDKSEKSIHHPEKNTAIALLTKYSNNFSSDQQPVKAFARIVKSSKTNYETKEKEESIIVQNQDDIERENMLRDYVHSQPNPSVSTPPFQKYPSLTNVHSECLPKQVDQVFETGKVKELSNDSSSQGKSSEQFNANPNSPVHSHDKIELSRISSNEQEEDKETNKSNFFEDMKDSLDDSLIIESEDNVNSLPTQIDKYVPRDCPLYKHLLISHKNSFKYLNPIGKGGFGSVVKARHLLDNNIYAIKKIKLHLGTDQDIKNHKVFREVQAMTIVNHVNVVRYYTCWLELAEDNEQTKERKKIFKRYSHYSKHTRKPRFTDTEPTELKTDKRERSNRSPYLEHRSSTSKYDKSDNSIEWEQGDDNSNPMSSFKGNESDAQNYQSNNESLSMFDEESKSKFNHDFTQSFDDASDGSSESSDSLDSIFDYTTCFDLLDKRKEFITVNLKIQMEICSGQTLKEYLEKRNGNNEKINRRTNFKIFKQIIEGIKHVHRQGIIHRDLKPANVFITGEGTIKIGDFGLARAIDKNDTKKISNLANVISNHIASSQGPQPYKKKRLSAKDKLKKDKVGLSLKVGTPLYLSPEQAEGIFYDEKVDIFSIGLILFELCYKFCTNHEKIMGFANLRRGLIPKEIEETMKPETAILKTLTQIDSSKRPSARNILKLEDYKAWKKEMCVEDDD